ncbi:MAG: exo-alpha-sialidase [Devosia sp.]|nr:exo-alpha-sialidase [Devosia sp.]
MQRLEAFAIYENPDPLLVSRQALFPGIIQLPDGELLALFSIGQAFDAADMRSFVSRSSDEGRTWSAPRRLNSNESTPPEQESFKPLLLRNGMLLATGYVFERPDPLQPIVDPVTLALPRLVPKLSTSRDGGAIWTATRPINIGGEPLELSGPATQLPTGRIIAPGSPFHLRRTGHAGWVVASDDGGENWFKLSEFFRAPGSDIHAFESRLVAWGEGRVAALWWAYDHTREVNLDNHIAFSSDGGARFGPAIGTGVKGQSSSLIHLEGETLLTIHTHREEPAGLIVRRVDVAGDGFRIEEELELFADPTMASTTIDMKQQFGNLKFGQPSLLRLRNGDLLAYCWSFENHQYIIKGFRIAL